MNKKKIILVSVAAVTVGAIITGGCLWYCGGARKAAAPKSYSVSVEKAAGKMDNADFYVSTVGSDKNDGSFKKPFQTIERARGAVRALDKSERDGITVAVMAGDYRTAGLVFTKEDAGTKTCPITYCAYGDGEVVINGGVTLKPSDFAAVTDEKLLSRLSKTARENVVCANLKTYGLTKSDWGRVNAIGSYNTAGHYAENLTGALYCELFYNDAAMTLARYPNGEDWLYTGKVIEEGEGKERAGDRVYRNPDWDTSINPKSDTYEIDVKLAKRVASWQSLDDVWMFGYWMYDWADASTLIGNFDAENNTLTPKYVSFYGAKEEAPYYFFNVFEELDAEGEFFIDRTNGILYLYKGESFDSAVIDLSITAGNIVKCHADYLTFKGFTFKGTRGDALVFEGNGNTVADCLIKNVSGYALKMTGCRNVALNNEITGTGQGGIVLSGGDRETLTPGACRAENNLIHDWSRIYKTYQPAVTLEGVGNVCAHNEMFNSPHEAITYSGNNHLIEYNDIHDVCLLSDDAGAIYSGRRWDWYGTVIRYNALYDLGANGHKPCGIYLDDALSGQTVYGNILVNVPGYALHIGGGRDNAVENNIVVNAGKPVSYDDRAREGALDSGSGWAEHFGENGGVWKLLFESPWQSDVWKKAFPASAKISSDFSDKDNKLFGANPALSTVIGNLIFDDEESIGNVADSVYTFSTVDNNAVLGLGDMKDFFTDPRNGDFSIKKDASGLPDGFEELPLSQIGRHTR